jgi:hypothetical protein
MAPTTMHRIRRMTTTRAIGPRSILSCDIRSPGRGLVLSYLGRSIGQSPSPLSERLVDLREQASRDFERPIHETIPVPSSISQELVTLDQSQGFSGPELGSGKVVDPLGMLDLTDYHRLVSLCETMN